MLTLGLIELGIGKISRSFSFHSFHIGKNALNYNHNIVRFYEVVAGARQGTSKNKSTAKYPLLGISEN